MLPDLVNGVLPPGVHDTTLDDVQRRFCAGSDRRRLAGIALAELLQALARVGARYVLVGGSFPTAHPEVADVDVIAVFARRGDVPSVAPHFAGAGIELDVQYASEDEPAILGAFVEFFGQTRDEARRGLVRLSLTSAPIETPQGAAPAVVDLVRAVYLNRHFQRTEGRRGLLVTIHGLLSHAQWNADVARLASSHGWVVAPFIYGYQTPWLLVSKSARARALDRFRMWLDQVVAEQAQQQQLPISVIAHSFGTYIAVAYLLGFDTPPHRFNGLVLTGCILDRSLDWSRAEGRVGRVLHERAPGDAWVRCMGIVRPVCRDPLMGTAGTTGFAITNALLSERTGELFNHNNVVAPDVIRGRWLPFLNAHSHSLTVPG